MTTAEKQYMQGWTYAARLATAGVHESQLALMCSAMLKRGTSDRVRGFCAGVLSGYHEIAESHTVLATLGGSH